MDGIELILSTICLNISCATNSSDAIFYTSFNYSENGESSNVVESRAEKDLKFSNYKEWLSGRTLRVGSLEDPPLSYTATVDGQKVGRGVAFQLMDFLTVKFNFTYEITIPQNNIIGSTSDAPGSLIELITQDKVDVAAAFLPILSDARNSISYSTTTLDEGDWIMIMTRPAESASGSGLLAPFDGPVWILILVSLLAVGPIIYLLIILRFKMTRDETQTIYPLPHCIWFVYGALMKQGSTLSPLADSTRLLFATWWIFITILTSFYTANLTAFLTLSKFTLPINSAQDILKKEKSFVTTRGGGVEYAIKNDGESLTFLTKLVDKNMAIFSEEINDTDILMTLVEKKNYVYIRDRPAIDHVIYSDYKYRKTLSPDNEKIHCPFAVSKTSFLKRKRAFAYQKTNNISELFDQQLLHLVESGIVKYMLSENLPRVEICPQNLGSTERQLRNSDLMMTYIVMITGFCTGVVVFASELIFKHLNHRNGLKTQMLLEGFGKNSPSLHSPPPPYASLFSRGKNPFLSQDYSDKTLPRKTINGRNYLVVKGLDGESRLIPMRTPSAALFQFSYSN